MLANASMEMRLVIANIRPGARKEAHPSEPSSALFALMHVDVTVDKETGFSVYSCKPGSISNNV